MKILNFGILLVLFTMSSISWAARIVPTDMQILYLKSAYGKQVVLSKKEWSPKKMFSLGISNDNRTFQINNNIRIRDEGNRFTTYNKLPQYVGRNVAVRFNRNNNIQEIWILTKEENLILKQRNNIN